MTFFRNLEFYEINPEDTDFANILQSIFSKNLTSTEESGRILEYSDSSIAITELISDDDYLQGIIMRVRTNDIPLKGSLLRNDFSQIDLENDEGIADMTYFCYIKELKILCILPAKNGVKWGTFRYYIQQNDEEYQDIDFSPLIRSDTRRILNSWHSITLIEAQIAIGNNSRSTSIETQQMPLSIALDETQRMQATRLKLELYNPKSRGGLVARTIRGLSNVISRLGGVCEAEHIKIKGSPSADECDTWIDLIEQKYKISIRLGRGGRFLDFIECQTEAIQKITENYEQIKALIE